MGRRKIPDAVERRRERDRLYAQQRRARAQARSPSPPNPPDPPAESPAIPATTDPSEPLPPPSHRYPTRSRPSRERFPRPLTGNQRKGSREGETTAYVAKNIVFNKCFYLIESIKPSEWVADKAVQGEIDEKLSKVPKLNVRNICGVHAASMAAVLLV